MFYILVAFNTAISLFFIIWAIKRMIEGRGFFCVIFPVAYIATNGLFIFSNKLASAIWLYDIQDSWMEKSIYSNIIFLSIAAIIIIRTERKSNTATRCKTETAYDKRAMPRYRPNQLLLVSLILFAITFEARYLFLSTGMERVYKSTEITDRDSAYMLRNDTTLAAGEGNGVFSAQLARELLYPLCALGLSYMVLVRRRYIYLFLALPLLILTALTAVSSLQRAPPFFFALVTISSIIWASLSQNNNDIKLNFINKRTIFSLIAMLIAGSALYSYTEAVNIYLGLYGLIERSFLITSFSGTSYYGIFGDYFPFQGISRLFGFPVEDPSSVTIRDIGRAANGYPHSLNANFVATAYGALGYFGVAFISASVLLACRYLDFLTNNSPTIEKLALLVVNIFVIFELCNAPLINGLLSGFVFNTYLFVLIFKKKISYR